MSTVDVVMTYSYGRSEHRLEDDNWSPQWMDAAMKAGKVGGLIKHMI